MLVHTSSDKLIHERYITLLPISICGRFIRNILDNFLAINIHISYGKKLRQDGKCNIFRISVHIT